MAAPAHRPPSKLFAHREILRCRIALLEAKANKPDAAVAELGAAIADLLAEIAEIDEAIGAAHAPVDDADFDEEPPDDPWKHRRDLE